MNQKRLAREFCFQFFYHVQLPVFEEIRKELSASGNDKLLLESIEEIKKTTNTLISDDLHGFVLKLISGSLTTYDTTLEVVSKYLKNWKFNRLSKVDQTILMLAAFELVNHKETAPGIVINEAVEIAKKFGTKESPSFVNGVLDNLVKNEL